MLFLLFAMSFRLSFAMSLPLSTNLPLDSRVKIQLFSQRVCINYDNRYTLSDAESRPVIHQQLVMLLIIDIIIII